MYYNLQKIKMSVEPNTCPDHGQHPVVSLSEQGNIEVKACCEKFGERMKELAANIATDDAIRGKMDNFLR